MSEFICFCVLLRKMSNICFILQITSCMFLKCGGKYEMANTINFAKLSNDSSNFGGIPKFIIKH